MALPISDVAGQQNAALHLQTTDNNVIGSQDQQKDESTSKRVVKVYVKTTIPRNTKLITVNGNGTFRDFKVATAQAFNIPVESVHLQMNISDKVCPPHYDDNTPLTQFKFGNASQIFLRRHN